MLQDFTDSWKICQVVKVLLISWIYLEKTVTENFEKYMLYFFAGNVCANNYSHGNLGKPSSDGALKFRHKCAGNQDYLQFTATNQLVRLFMRKVDSRLRIGKSWADLALFTDTNGSTAVLNSEDRTKMFLLVAEGRHILTVSHCAEWASTKILRSKTS